MFKEQLRQAVLDKDWESVKHLQDLQDRQFERIIRLQEMRMRMQQAEAQNIKTLAEAEKMSREAKYSISTFLAAIVGAIVALGTFVRSLFQ